MATDLQKAPLSLLILTYNEEVHLERALESARGWAGEIIVIDSGSTDKTLEICRQHGVKVFQHPFKNQAEQFNWAIDHVPVAHPWIMRLDADETVTPELALEITQTLPTLPESVTGLYLKRRVFFMGRWIRHGDYYPMWFLRIFRKGAGRYEEIAEEHILLSRGKALHLKHDFIDDNRKGLSFWVDKHNHWAVGEMLDLLHIEAQGALPAGTVPPGLFSTQERRRRWLKVRVYARLPLFFRAFLYFLYRYVLRFGFLDGREGLIFHFLQGCWYRFLVDAKIVEARKFGVDRAVKERGYTSSKPWELPALKGADR